ncbi:MAG: AbrB/MazE/SpoVT family DNA-binding domain-containing protein [Microthrixaceae bacterium]
MRTTIDKAGRLVVPKSLRDRLGIRAGEVEITVDGAALRIEAVTDDSVEELGDWLVIPSTGEPVTVEQIQDLRDADQS